MKKMFRHKVQLQDLFALVGLDTSVLIDLMMQSAAKKFFAENLYLFEADLLFTHRVCLAECLGLLTGRHGFSKEEAREKIRAFLEEFKMHRIFHRFRTGGVKLRTLTGFGGKFWHSKGTAPSEASIPPVSDRWWAVPF